MTDQGYKDFRFLELFEYSSVNIDACLVYKHLILLLHDYAWNKASEREKLLEPSKALLSYLGLGYQ